MKDSERLANARIYNARIQHPRISYDNEGYDLVFGMSFDVQIGKKIKYAKDSFSLNLERMDSGTVLKDLMVVVGVDNFKDLAEQYVRIAYDTDGKVIAIGHILGNDWFFYDDWFFV